MKNNFAFLAALQTGFDEPSLSDMVGGIELLTLYIDQRLKLNLPISTACQEISEALKYFSLHASKLKDLERKYQVLATKNDISKIQREMYERIRDELNNINTIQQDDIINMDVDAND